MEGNRVYLAACPDYGQAEAKLREAVAALGGMEGFVRPGERILLKANLLRAAPPESAICTHPAVAAAAAKLVAEAGGTAVITDSPGGALHKEAVLRGLYEKTGMAQAAAASGAELCYDASTRTVSLPAGRVLKQAEVIAPVAEADGVFDLPKLKTHVLMSMTGAVKNLFGLLPGLSKVGYHATHPSQEQFADVLLDLAEYVRPRLSIMDGVLAMAPENITVHTLALKKGSTLMEKGGAIPSGEETARMLEYSLDALGGAGYHPYYLYRQKYMSGSLENVGWTLPGLDSVYNIAMMEELHTIVSLGGGGVTKLVDRATGYIERLANAKYPQEYIQKIDAICADKARVAQFYAAHGR